MNYTPRYWMTTMIDRQDVAAWMDLAHEQGERSNKAEAKLADLRAMVRDYKLHKANPGISLIDHIDHLHTAILDD